MNINDPAIIKFTDFSQTEWKILVEKDVASDKSRYIYLDELVNTTTVQTVAGAKTFSDNLQVNAQAHGGYYIKPFSASATFNANNGNNQQMDVTASTTIAIINEVPGTFVITLIIDTGTPPTIEIDSSLGNPYDNNPDFAIANGDENTITVLVKPDGTKRYTINTITA